MAYPPKKAVSDAFDEVTNNPPKVVKSTQAKFGAPRARKQTVAIALNKARKSSGMKPMASRPRSYYAARKYSKV